MEAGSKFCYISAGFELVGYCSAGEERIGAAMQKLAEGCIAHILSYTTPVDAARLSLVFKAFRSAAESDTVWDRFLVSDLPSIISPSSFPSSNSKKDLYFTLSHRPLIIDHGTKSFQLDKRTGKKCYMLSTRHLTVSGDSLLHWRWTTMFQEVGKLRAMHWFNISGRIDALALSSNTHYAAFLVFKMIEDNEFYYHIAMLQSPKVRSDGWLEIEIGEFFISSSEEDQVLKVAQTTGLECHMFKCNFIIEGIEFRPKHVSSVE